MDTQLKQSVELLGRCIDALCGEEAVDKQSGIVADMISLLKAIIVRLRELADLGPCAPGILAPSSLSISHLRYLYTAVDVLWETELSEPVLSQAVTMWKEYQNEIPYPKSMILPQSKMFSFRSLSPMHGVEKLEEMRELFVALVFDRNLQMTMLARNLKRIILAILAGLNSTSSSRDRLASLLLDITNRHASLVVSAIRDGQRYKQWLRKKCSHLLALIITCNRELGQYRLEELKDGVMAIENDLWWRPRHDGGTFGMMSVLMGYLDGLTDSPNIPQLRQLIASLITAVPQGFSSDYYFLRLIPQIVFALQTGVTNKDKALVQTCSLIVTQLCGKSRDWGAVLVHLMAAPMIGEVPQLLSCSAPLRVYAEGLRAKLWPAVQCNSGSGTMNMTDFDLAFRLLCEVVNSSGAVTGALTDCVVASGVLSVMLQLCIFTQSAGRSSALKSPVTALCKRLLDAVGADRGCTVLLSLLRASSIDRCMFHLTDCGGVEAAAPASALTYGDSRCANGTPLSLMAAAAANGEASQLKQLLAELALAADAPSTIEGDVSASSAIGLEWIVLSELAHGISLTLSEILSLSSPTSTELDAMSAKAHTSTVDSAGSVSGSELVPALLFQNCLRSFLEVGDDNPEQEDNAAEAATAAAAPLARSVAGIMVVALQDRVSLEHLLLRGRYIINLLAAYLKRFDNELTAAEVMGFSSRDDGVDIASSADTVDTVFSLLSVMLSLGQQGPRADAEEEKALVNLLPVLQRIALTASTLSSRSMDEVAAGSQLSSVVQLCSSVSRSASDVALLLLTRSTNKSRDESSKQTFAVATALDDVLANAAKELAAADVPSRAYGIRLLVIALRQRDECHEPMNHEHVHLFFKLLLIGLRDSDSFVYLSALQALVQLSDRCRDIMLDTLMNQHFICSAEPIRFRCAVGEALTKVLRRAGDAAPHYAPMVFAASLFVFRQFRANVIDERLLSERAVDLQKMRIAQTSSSSLETTSSAKGAQDDANQLQRAAAVADEVLLRQCALSAMAECVGTAGWSCYKFTGDILDIAHGVLTMELSHTQAARSARRAAAFCLCHLIKTLQSKMLFVGDNNMTHMKRFYDMLKFARGDSDVVVRFHAESALGHLDEVMREQLFPMISPADTKPIDIFIR